MTAKAKPSVIKDFTKVKLTKHSGQKPLPANDPVILDFIKKAAKDAR